MVHNLAANGAAADLINQAIPPPNVLPQFPAVAGHVPPAGYLQQYVTLPTEKISTLLKNIVKLAHGNFAAWQKAINR